MQPEPMDPRQQEAVAAYHRLRRLRHRVALGLAVLVLGAALVFWVGRRLFTIDPGTGTPLGLAVRTDAHIAVLLQRLEAYVPSPARDHGRDTYSVSLLLVPLDGGSPVQVPISGGHAANSLGLARILGSDGHVLWYNVNGVGWVDLRTHRPVPEDVAAEVEDETVLLTRVQPEPTADHLVVEARRIRRPEQCHAVDVRGVEAGCQHVHVD